MGLAKKTERPQASVQRPKGSFFTPQVQPKAPDGIIQKMGNEEEPVQMMSQKEEPIQKMEKEDEGM